MAPDRCVAVLWAAAVVGALAAGAADTGGTDVIGPSGFSPTSPTVPWLAIAPAPLSLCASEAWLGSNLLPPTALLRPVHAVALDATRVLAVGIAPGCDPLSLPPPNSPAWLPCTRNVRGVVAIATQVRVAASDHPMPRLP